MEFQQPVRMAEGSEGPVWARSRRRAGGGNPVVGFIITVLALFGALTAALAIKERSVAEGGAILDGWIAAGWDAARRATGQADEAAAKAAAEAGQAAEKAGDALETGAEAARDELKGG